MAGQKSNNIYDNAYVGWGTFIVILCFLIYLFWTFYHVEIRNVVRWIRYAEIMISYPFMSDDYTVVYKEKEYSYHGSVKKVPEYKKEEMKYQHLAIFSALAMQPLKMPIVYILGLGTIWCLFMGPNTQHRRRFKLEDLIEVQSKNFPVISPFVKFNPSKQPPRPPGAPVPAELPPFAEALGPEEWLAYNSIPVPDGKVDEEAAADAFIAQLGGRWKGPLAIAPYKQILLAAFCLKASRKRSEADDMLGALARCWSVEEGLNLNRNRKLLREAQGILKNKDLAGKTLALCNQHAFETTALLRGLATAREQGGVLAAAQFVWLRAHDRALWYPLNNMGRQSFHIEALGAMSHYKIEKMTRRPIPVPKVDDSVKTIKDYMASKRARPIPPLDYSKSKKRGVKKAV